MHSMVNCMTGKQSVSESVSGTDIKLTGPMRLVLALAPRWQRGTIRVRLPNGETVEHTGPQPGGTAEIIIKDQKAARRLLTGGTVGIAEPYIRGEWDTPDLRTFLTVAAENEAILTEAMRGSVAYRVISRILHLTRRNSKRGSKRNISFHYDLGNEFYAHWLDTTMTYSAAQFDEQTSRLEQGQENKYRLLAERMALQPGQHVLEIGCGWGGFAEYAAKNYGCRVTGLTISQEQHDYAAQRVQREGLNEQVEIRLQDYRDVEGTYDRIASIEMFEAVGQAYWPLFFKTLRSRLVEGGKAALQVITIDDSFWDEYRTRPDFIQRYIFPGGMLPCPSELRRQIKDVGLDVVSEDWFGEHYAHTIAEWYQRFQEAWPRIAAHGFDARFKRTWEYYLAYCEAGFRSRCTDVVRIAVAPA